MYKLMRVCCLLVFCCLLGCESKVAQNDDVKEVVSSAQNTSSLDSVVPTMDVKNKDTIVPLKGNQLFSKSVKLRYLYYLNGYILKEIEVMTCEESLDGTQDYKEDKKLKSINIEGHSFRIEFTVIGNCCSEFLCEAEIVEESTLNIIYHEFGRHCSCNCKFTLAYTFEVDTDYIKNINLPKTKIKHLQFNDDPNSRASFKNIK